MVLRVLIGILCFIGIALSSLTTISNYLDAQEAKTWSRQDATVSDISTYQRIQGRNSFDCLLVHVRFIYQGVVRTTILEVPDACENAVSLVNNFHEDEKLTVFVNPNDPSKVRVIDGFLENISLKGILGGMVTIFLMWSLWQRIKQNNNALKMADEDTNSTTERENNKAYPQAEPHAKAPNKKGSVFMLLGAFISIFTYSTLGSSLQYLKMVGGISFSSLVVILFLESSYCKLKDIHSFSEARRIPELPVWFRIIDKVFDIVAGHILGLILLVCIVKII
jgi:hypothetical protein